MGIKKVSGIVCMRAFLTVVCERKPMRRVAQSLQKLKRWR